MNKYMIVGTLAPDPNRTVLRCCWAKDDKTLADTVKKLIGAKNDVDKVLKQVDEVKYAYFRNGDAVFKIMLASIIEQA